MIITLSKKEFTDAVNSCVRFTQKSSATLPVLTGIVIVAGDDGVKLRATNLETGIDVKIDGSIKESGVVAIPSQVLKEITTSFSPTGSITIEHTGDTVLLSSPTGKSTLKTLPYEDFPTLPLPENIKATIALPGAILRTLVGAVVGCASTSTVRPDLASVLISLEGGVLTSVATDSFRLAEKKIPLKTTATPFSMLIPAKNLHDIIQTLPDEDIEIKIDEHQAAFYWKGGVLTTRLVTVNYPDYTQIIPKSFITDATVLKKDFETTLRRSAVFSDTFQKIRMSFNVAAKQLVLSAQNSDIGDSSEVLTGSISGESIDLSFNHRYLQAPLSIISSENITISASGIGRAAVIRGTGDTSFLYLVMPMNQ